MLNTLILAFLVAVLTLPTSSHAQQSCGWSMAHQIIPQSFQDGFPTAMAACQWAISGGWSGGSVTGTITSEASGWCQVSRSDGANFAISATDTGVTCAPVATCSEPVGALATTNVTTGWAASPTKNAADFVLNYGVPDAVQDSTCRGTVLDSGVCYRSQVPAANGLYRVSCDVLFIVTGDPEPGQEDANADPATSPPTCPGFLGEVNGTTRCVGSPTSPLPLSPSTYPSPHNAGNPTAGPNDNIGPRTPLTGSGGNEGGPALAAGPSFAGGGLSDDPNTPQIEFPDPCGAPGQPPCAVVFDETGVPSASEAPSFLSDNKTGLDQVDGKFQTALNTAKEVEAPAWTWTFSLPTGCSPLPMGAFGFEVNICEFQPVIHDLVSMLWVAAGIFGLLGLLRSALGGQT